jgi:hypothetical protein
VGRARPGSTRSVSATAWTGLFTVPAGLDGLARLGIVQAACAVAFLGGPLAPGHAGGRAVPRRVDRPASATS